MRSVFWTMSECFTHIIRETMKPWSGFGENLLIISRHHNLLGLQASANYFCKELAQTFLVQIIFGSKGSAAKNQGSTITHRLRAKWIRFKPLFLWCTGGLISYWCPHRIHREKLIHTLLKSFCTGRRLVSILAQMYGSLPEASPRTSLKKSFSPMAGWTKKLHGVVAS